MDWNEIANTSLSEIERPPVRPQGHYQAVITGNGRVDNSTKKGTLFIEFPVQVQEAMDDVDSDELAAAGGANFKGNVTFWLTSASMWRFKEFAKGMGASDEMNIAETAEYLASCGEPLVVEGRHEPDAKNPEGPPFFRIENPVPLSAWQNKG